jgi:AhpC/TSA family
VSPSGPPDPGEPAAAEPAAAEPAAAEPAAAEPVSPQSPVLARRLDPDLAVSASASAARAPALPPPVIDTKRYRWMIGTFGIVLVLITSVYQFATNGVGTTGVAPGKRLHLFAAPLAGSTLNGDANLKPPCSPAHHDPRALNICLMVQRAPLALAFFATGSDDCKRQVDTMQALSRRYPASEVQFAAVAVGAGHAETRSLVRSRGWTIPIAYDADGAVQSLYGVQICPMVELAYRGGIVKDRLIGNHWLTTDALVARVRALIGR